MDNFNCLKALTEDIVDKQHHSLESLETLSRKTNAVSSDISNLINSLQMVGNKQFAENRVHEDELISEQLQQRKDISLIEGPQVPVSRRELKLSSILLKAIEHISTPDSHDTPPNHTLESEDTQSEKTRSVDSTESSQRGENEEENLHELDEKVVSQIEEEQSDHPKENLIAPKINRSLDRDRVVDILKRYSLYDDDEDESE